MTYQEHQRESQPVVARCGVITLSDTRTDETDASGQRIRALLLEAGHAVAGSLLIPDDAVMLSKLLDDLLAAKDIDVILTNGGTGISPRDRTIGVIQRKLTSELPGFGELFRMLSWEQIGSGAMLSRAAGGVARDKLLFAMPGSPKAVELAMTRLILPELRHLLHQLRRDAGT
ncbi:MAG TPA: MogA/MoaB family molybdenum cofactor biosynthesis protein [Tepidisphaeraceae bacterium]|nr:MogA/MoaB family molybdenum cofactor biosynthesis protein [Tepidisphaeraceae bacterium]